MRVVIVLLAIWVTAMLGYMLYEHFGTGGKGTIVVLSEPSGAEILLDLRPTAIKTSGVLSGVSAGEHSVTVQLQNHLSDPYVAVATVRAGSVDTIQFVLSPFASGGARSPRRLGTDTSRVTPTATTATDEPDTLLARLRKEREDREAALRQSDIAGTAVDDLVVIPPSHPVNESSLKQDTTSADTHPVADRGPTTGTIEISSSVPGAAILVNERPTELITPASLTLEFGTYVIRVELEGYKSDPAEQSLRVSRGSSSQFVYFTLEKPSVKEIVITTTPVEGEIFVDSVSVGTGSAIVPHQFGVFNITFGAVEGFRAPDPVRLSITPSKPRPEVTGVYTRRFTVSATAAGASEIQLEGAIEYSVGVFSGDGGYTPSTAQGPRVREIPGTQKFGWELAMGDPNRNPTGEDFVEFSFELPDEISLEAPLNLRLYIYRSPRRYPLSLGGKSELIVTVNGRSFLPAYSPRSNSDGAEFDRYEEWSLQGMLTHGTNKIVIRSSPENTVYHYLWKLEIL